jgi:four helix bundle protein
MLNIAEGIEREGNKELVQFLYIAKGSAGELRSLIKVAKRENCIDKATYDDIRKDLLAISRMIAGFIKYLKNSGVKGNKFKKAV